MLIEKPKVFGEWHLQIGDLVYILPTDKDITKQRIGRYEGYRYEPGMPVFLLPNGNEIEGDVFGGFLYGKQRKQRKLTHDTRRS